MDRTLRTGLVTALAAVGLATSGATQGSDAAPAQATASQRSAASRAAEPGRNEALAAALRDPDPYARARKLGALLPKLGPEAIPQVREALGDLALDVGATELGLLLHFWASHEPEKATKWAVNQSQAGYRIAAVFATLPLWAAADPKAAKPVAGAWMMRSDVGSAAMIALIRGLYARDPAEAVRYIESFEMGWGRQRAIATYLHAMLKHEGVDAAVRWAEAVAEEDEAYKLAVYRQMASLLPLFDHEAGLRWCEAHCEGPFGSSLREIIARRWVRRDGAAALAWLAEAPEGPERKVALRVAYMLWGQVAPDEARGWMAARLEGSGEEPEEWLRPMVPEYARLLARESPLEAIAWAERIEAPDDREATLVDVWRVWRMRDEAAAEAWLEGSPMAERVREKARARARLRPDLGQAQ